MDKSAVNVVDTALMRRTLERGKIRVRKYKVIFEEMLADDSSGTLDYHELKEAQDLLQSLHANYNEEFYRLQEAEDDESQLEADDAEFHRELTRVKKQCNLFLSLRAIYRAVQNMDFSVITLNNAWMKEPKKEHTTTIKSVVYGVKDLKTLLDKSNMDVGHPLRAQAAEVCERAALLLAKVEKPPSREGKPVIKTESTNSGYKRAHLTVPKFSGELKDWHPFWNSFREAVHDATDLKKSVKLSYLKEAMKDKVLWRVLNRITDDEDYYDTAVQELKERFDKPR